MPDEYSDALKAVYLDELTQTECADLNGINLSTVKSQIKKGKESMKNSLINAVHLKKIV